MTELADKAQDIQNSAQGEFDALGDFEKIRAVAKTAKLIAALPKIPAFMKQAIKDIETEINQLKELQQELNKD
jgi:hypothetical protein